MYITQTVIICLKLPENSVRNSVTYFDVILLRRFIFAASRHPLDK